MPRVLAGDIGGTKTILAIYTSDRGLQQAECEKIFRSAEYDGLDAIARTFLAEIDQPVDRACFGVAGPVVDGRVKTTNLPWELDEVQLAQALELEQVTLLNDLVATANAVPQLQPSDLHVLNAGRASATGPIAVVAPGTGLGEAYLIHDGERYRALPSEGGHTTFGPATELEMDLVRYLLHHFGHVSFERVCSGIGIPNIYRFLKETGRAAEPDWLAQKMRDAQDPTPLIVAGALDRSRPCELCQLTMELFISILGGEASNLALTVLSTGGVYLGGGIPPRILPLLETPTFMQAFLNKGRMSALLDQMPVRVILNSKAALLGAARYGLELA